MDDLVSLLENPVDLGNCPLLLINMGVNNGSGQVVFTVNDLEKNVEYLHEESGCKLIKEKKFKVKVIDSNNNDCFRIVKVMHFSQEELLRQVGYVDVDVDSICFIFFGKFEKSLMDFFLLHSGLVDSDSSSSSTSHFALNLLLKNSTPLKCLFCCESSRIFPPGREDILVVCVSVTDTEKEVKQILKDALKIGKKRKGSKKATSVILCCIDPVSRYKLKAKNQNCLDQDALKTIASKFRVEKCLEINTTEPVLARGAKKEGDRVRELAYSFVSSCLSVLGCAVTPFQTTGTSQISKVPTSLPEDALSSVQAHLVNSLSKTLSCCRIPDISKHLNIPIGDIELQLKKLRFGEPINLPESLSISTMPGERSGRYLIYLSVAITGLSFSSQPFEWQYAKGGTSSTSSLKETARVRALGFLTGVRAPTIEDNNEGDLEFKALSINLRAGVSFHPPSSSQSRLDRFLKTVTQNPRKASFEALDFSFTINSLSLDCFGSTAVSLASKSLKKAIKSAAQDHVAPKVERAIISALQSAPLELETDP